MPENFAAVTVVQFSDGGADERRVIYRGTEANCQRLVERIPALVYSGDRPAASAFAVVCPLASLEGDEIDSYVPPPGPQEGA